MVSVKINLDRSEIEESMPLFLGQFRFSDVPFPKTVEQWLHALTTPFSITLFAIGFFGLFVGWLLGRSARKEREQISPPDSGQKSELEWRHEKLVLLERQEADLQDRIQELVASIPESDLAFGTELKCRLFGLSEQMRELRQRVGSDLSRLGCVRERLIELRGPEMPRQEAIAMCEEMASAQEARLEEMREHLREPARSIIEITERLDASEAWTAESRDQLVEELSPLQDSIRDLPVDLITLTVETDEQIRDLLKSGGEPEFESLWKVLLVDGAVSSSRENHEYSPWQQLRAILNRLREWKPAPETPPEPEVGFESPDVPRQYRLALPIRPLTPDQGFQPPVQAAAAEHGNGNGNGNGSHAEAGETENKDSEGPESGSLVVFRSNRSEDWGKTFYEGKNRRARSLESVPSWAQWISLQRIDTGERVVVPASSFLTSSDDVSSSHGFNASREKFYGAHHLGVFSDACPNEVETLFTYGGWGFGHRVTESGEGPSDPQASGWAGKEISSDTVFEICLLKELPESAEGDVVLDEESVEAEVSLGVRGGV